MRLYIFIFFFVSNVCIGQELRTKWQLEVMPGVSGYMGDLTQSFFPVRTSGPAVNINLRYDSGDMLLFRTGIAFGKISGNDKYNTQADIKARNLNFKTLIWEINTCVEINFLDPEVNYVYPYLFGGLGLFHFNPYSFDKNNQKTYLHPLSTEGQGLPEYPERKKYSLTQFCLPFGFGIKANINDKYIIGAELGVRYLFTDYIDDVSTTYVDYETLLREKGPLAAELSVRTLPYVPPYGEIRGNPKAKDMYCFGGVKIAFFIGE